MDSAEPPGLWGPLPRTPQADLRWGLWTTSLLWGGLEESEPLLCLCDPDPSWPQKDPLQAVLHLQ